MKRSLLYLAIVASPLAAEETPSLSRHISPMLYQLGCSAGTCHGSFSGKGGLRLALFAGNADQDHANLRGVSARRIDPMQPERSLLLLKPTLGIEHMGGKKLTKGTWQYDLLRRWIEAGAPYDPAAELKVLSLRTEPATLTVPVEQTSQPLKAFAKLSNGTEEEVTKFTRFEALDPGIAEVDATGKVKGVRTGDIAILAHYAGEIGFTIALIPGKPTGAFPDEKYADNVDRLLAERMKMLNIVPSPRCDDLDFQRRVYLDVIGQLPTPQQVRAFLKDTDPNKRAKLIDVLLADPLHNATWATRFCEMLGADDRFIGGAVYNFHDWFRNKLEANMPWDKISYGVLCATAADDRPLDEIKEDLKRIAEERKKGIPQKPRTAANPEPTDGKKAWQVGYGARKTLDTFHNMLLHSKTIPGKQRGPDGSKIALRVAHAFLGMRLECAQCHKHPYDRWSQGDFFSFSAAFSHVGFGTDPELQKLKVALSGVHATMAPHEEFLDPETRAVLPPRIPGGAVIEIKPGVDARKEVWKWMAQADNPFFASAMVNRVWEHYLGRGFIDPADNQAAANPPSHPEVLDELVKDFIAHKFDLRHLHRRILNTLAYQRDWRTNPSNARDERNFSHRKLRRLNAEQALDAIAQVTGTPVKFGKRFADARDNIKAAEVALSRIGGDDAYVLQIFGRPIRVQNCDCERSGAASLSQTLYLFNDEKLIAKVHDPKGTVKKLVDSKMTDDAVIEELYLLTMTRFPTKEEVMLSKEFVKKTESRLEAYQDLAWSLLNRHDFVINR